MRKSLAAVALLSALIAPVAAHSQAPSSAATEQVTIQEVQVGLTDLGPVVLLMAEGRGIPIFVDLTVASSIRGALSGERTGRPMSHDLMHSILDSFGGTVTQAAITLRDTTFHAALTVRFGNETKVFDSRSSDSIALAVHFKAPILVSRELLESAGKPLPPKPGGVSM